MHTTRTYSASIRRRGSSRYRESVTQAPTPEAGVEQLFPPVRGCRRPERIRTAQRRHVFVVDDGEYEVTLHDDNGDRYNRNRPTR